MCELNYLIAITPLGHLYGSSGGFLSPANLVGRSREKFPPDSSTLGGLISGIDKQLEKSSIDKNLYVVGGFWAMSETPESFFVPMPWTKIIAEDGWNEWQLDADGNWQKAKENDVEPEYQWINIDAWDQDAATLRDNRSSKVQDSSVGKNPWYFVPMLHPKMQSDERHVVSEDGLFLEYAVQLPEDICLVYLSSHPIDDGWYRFGGENHIVELTCQDLSKYLKDKFNDEIQQDFALITPGIWGSNRFSRRYPDAWAIPEEPKLLTDKPIPIRSRSRGALQRGRYGVPAGSVYSLATAINQPWKYWSRDWFPSSGYSLKQVGYGCALPLTINRI